MKTNSGPAADDSSVKMSGCVMNVIGRARESRMVDQILGCPALPTRYSFQVEPVWCARRRERPKLKSTHVDL